jgi:hypothetical protein
MTLVALTSVADAVVAVAAAVVRPDRDPPQQITARQPDVQKHSALSLFPTA